jgi:rhodanese-related sulfurtransferase
MKMKKRMLVGLVMALFALSLAGAALAQQKGPQMPQAVKDMVAKAKASLKTASTDEVKAVTEKKSKAILLDARTKGEYAAGHMPGAINVDRGLLEFSAWKTLKDQNAEIIVYCKTGARAALAGKTLQDIGYKNVRLSAIHYEPWVKAGNPVQR